MLPPPPFRYGVDSFRTPPLAQCHLYELGVLQRGWDSVMDAIYEFFSTVSGDGTGVL